MLLAKLQFTFIWRLNFFLVVLSHNIFQADFVACLDPIFQILECCVRYKNLCFIRSQVVTTDDRTRALLLYLIASSFFVRRHPISINIFVIWWLFDLHCVTTLTSRDTELCFLSIVKHWRLSKKISCRSSFTLSFRTSLASFIYESSGSLKRKIEPGVILLRRLWRCGSSEGRSAWFLWCESIVLFGYPVSAQRKTWNFLNKAFDSSSRCFFFLCNHFSILFQFFLNFLSLKVRLRKVLFNINLYSRFHYSLKLHLAFIIGPNVRLILWYFFDCCRKLVQESVFVLLILVK